MSNYDLGTARGIIEIEYRGDGAKQATKSLQGVSNQADESSKKMSKAGTALGGAGAVIAGGFALAMNKAADFEKQLSNVQAVSGASTAEMEQLRAKSLQLGKDTAFSASESAQAIEELVKAGLSVQDVMNGAADSTVALAAAGEVSMPEAATIASNAMNQFGIAAKEMPKVADNIAGAANASAIDVKDFGYSLGQVGAVAHLAGAKFDDTATAIALLGNAGIKGSDAGTSLKAMFQRLIPQTNKAVVEMEDLGIITLNTNKAMKLLRDNGIKPMGRDSQTLNDQINQLAAGLVDAKAGSAKAAKEQQKLMLQSGALSNAFYDQAGNLKSLDQVSQVLQKSLKGMNAQQKQATLTTLFGSDAIRGAAVLADRGAKGFNEMAKSMGKVTAADVAAKRMDNLKGALEQLSGSWETLQIQIGTPLVKALRVVVDMLTEVLNKVIELPGPVVSAVATFMGLMSAGLLVAGAFLKIRAAIMAGQGALALFAGPIGLIIAAIAALIAGFIYFYKTNETFRKGVNAVAAAIKSALLAAFEKIKSVIPTVMAIIQRLVQVAMRIADVFMKYVMPSVKEAASMIMSALGGAIKKIVPAFMAVLPAVQDFIKSAIDLGAALLGRLQPAITLIMNILKVLAGVFIAVILPTLIRVGGIFESVFIDMVGNALRTALGVVKGVLNVISGLFKIFTGLLTGNWSKAWEGVKQVLRGAVGIIGSILRGMLANAGAIIRGLGRLLLAGLKAIPGLLKGAGGLFLAAGRFLIDQFANGMKNAAGIVGGIAGNVWNAVRGLLNGAIDRINRALEFKINAGPVHVSINPPDIPHLATGGVTNGSMLAVVGDNPGGREVVSPLDQLWATMDRVYKAGNVAMLENLRQVSSSKSDAAPAADTGNSRLVSGTLSLDASGRAFIEGVAQDVYDDNDDHDSVVGRMGGR